MGESEPAHTYPPRNALLTPLGGWMRANLIRACAFGCVVLGCSS